jgi:hypothetical protein
VDFLVGFLVVFEVEDSVELSVADSLFGDFSLFASVFLVLLLVESAPLFLSVLFEELVDVSVVELLVLDGLLVVAGTEALVEGFVVEVGGWTGAVAAGEATGFAVAVTPGVMVAAVLGVALAATLAVAAGVALGAAVAFVDALVFVVVVAPVVVVPVVFVTPMLKLGVTP